MSRLLLPIGAMAAIVAASNYLVQFPVAFTLGGLNLADWLTWGAFSYPLAFLVTDLTNRALGPTVARRVVIAGFVVAVILSLWLATPRIALASGTAFLIAQLLDVQVFDRLRRLDWWKAPLISSLIGSVLDTAIFFSLAFGGEPLPWIGWAFGDLIAKLVTAAFCLGLFRIAMPRIAALPAAAGPDKAAA